MKIAGIIAEYNPFHKGHEYQIQETRKKYDVDYIIVVTSGHFVQRGEPALLDKWERTKIALLGGADLVLELPTIYATSSSKNFAYGAVALLSALGVVDYLSFGSELGDLSPLMRLSDYLCNEPVEFRHHLQEELKTGASYPLARSKALEACYPESVAFIKGSNNILALEYLKALQELKSEIRPVTIRRIGADYLNPDINESLPSASAIRAFLSNVPIDPLPVLEKALPPKVHEHFKGILNRHFYPVFPKDIYPVLSYLLQNSTEKEIEACYDFPLHLFRRLQKQLQTTKNYDELIEAATSKNYTKTTVQRSLIHLLLRITGEQVDQRIKDHYHYYLRVLGFKKESSILLHHIKAKSNLPIVTNINDRLDSLCPKGKIALQDEIRYTQIYQQIVKNKYHHCLADEYRRGMILL